MSDATVVAEEFNDDIDSFDTTRRTTRSPVSRRSGRRRRASREERRKENGCDVNTLVDSLDFLPSQPMAGGETRQDFSDL